MSKAKDIARYVLGVDVWKERIQYHREHKNDSAGCKIYDISDTITTLIARYAPLGLEIVTAVALMEGQYKAGIVGVIGAELVRAGEYQYTRRRRMNEVK